MSSSCICFNFGTTEARSINGHRGSVTTPVFHPIKKRGRKFVVPPWWKREAFIHLHIFSSLTFVSAS